MATLTLRNVPDKLEASLKARAKRHRRSLNNETFAAMELAGCNGDRGHVCAGCRVC
jgi:plasmid stability protein